mmetsp:Transcript_29027/g.44897  ORF Transcript_29027/g.44897 Transcript_29027/m.44897 type:complete len:108 (-) Transcript_29027:271-594(-)
MLKLPVIPLTREELMVQKLEWSLQLHLMDPGEDLVTAHMTMVGEEAEEEGDLLVDPGETAMDVDVGHHQEVGEILGGDLPPPPAEGAVLIRTNQEKDKGPVPGLLAL